MAIPPGDLELASQRKKKQTSFDITNTPAGQSRLSIDMPTARVGGRPGSLDRAGVPSAQAAGSQALARPVTTSQLDTAPAGIGYAQTGIAGIAGRVGANGVPEFTNDKAALAGAAAKPSLGMSRVGDGIGGGISHGEAGDAQMAIDRFERANQERAKMIASQRAAEGGGRLTVIRDSSRPPSIAEIQHSRMDERTAQAEALRNRSAIDQQRLSLDSRELERNLASDQISQQKAQQELQAGKLALDGDVRMNTLRAQLADPTITGEQRALAERNLLLTADPAGYLANQAKSGTYRIDMENKQLEQQVLRQKLEQGQLKAEQTQQDRAKAAEGAAATFELAIGSADRLLEHPGLDRAVGLSSLAPSLPGGDAANFEAQLDTLKAQTFLPQVQALKGAGALSDAEGKKLSEAVGALSTRMSPEAFRGELKRVRNSLAQAQERALRGIPTASQGRQAPAAAAPAQIKNDDEYAALPSGTVFTDPDGITRRKP